MRFSVIIPLYNKESYVRKAIESVLTQTFKDFELIVVDDGSTDGGAKVVEGFNDTRLNLIRQKNAGVSIARNNGAAASSAPFLCFLDADDWWDPTFLEEMDKLIKEFPDAGIYGTNYTIVNETKRKTRVAPIGLHEGFECGYINYCQAYSMNLGMPLTSSSICIPKNVFFTLGGFPEGITLGEDFILWIHIALRYKVALLNKPLSYYNQDVGTDLRAVGRLHAPEQHMLWNLRDLEQEEETNPDYKRLIDKLRVAGLKQYYMSGRYYNAAVEELAKVDWTKQPISVWLDYHSPVVLLRTKNSCMTFGSAIKTKLRRLI